jgi:phosphate acetyltransferase
MKCIFKRKDILDELNKRAAFINSESARKIVFADSDDIIIRACSEIKKRKIATPIILGDSSKLHEAFKNLGIANLDEENIIDYLLPENKERFDSFSEEYRQLCWQKGKNISAEEAAGKMRLPQYYGAMLVNKDLAHGMIAGLNSSTKPYYPVFEIIKMASGVKRTSGVFMMVSGKKVYFFADCVANINPPVDVLAEIALLSADTCTSFGMTPRVAMLSFSTKGSSRHEMVDKVKLATDLVKKKNPELLIDGEIQADAALVPEVCARKFPDSMLKGKANVLIFPDLNSGNIGYKLVERLGGFKAAGPFLQGLRKPVNDLSRGCSMQDIVDVAAVTVIQSIKSEQSLPVSEKISEKANGKIIETKKIEKFSGSKPIQTKLSESGSGSDENKIKKMSDIDKLPANVRKIIDEGRAKSRKRDDNE